MESNLDYSREKKLPSTVSSLTKPRFIDLSRAKIKILLSTGLAGRASSINANSLSFMVSS